MIDLSRSQWEALIDEWVVGYSNCGRDREIMKMRYLDGISVERIAEIKDIDVRTVTRVCTRCRRVVFSKVDK